MRTPGASPPGQLPAPADIRAHVRVIGEELAAGKGRGSVSTGNRGIAWLLGDLARIGQPNGTGKRGFPGVTGEAIRFPFPLRSGSFNCYAILSCRTLSLMSARRSRLMSRRHPCWTAYEKFRAATGKRRRPKPR